MILKIKMIKLPENYLSYLLFCLLKTYTTPCDSQKIVKLNLAQQIQYAFICFMAQVKKINIINVCNISKRMVYFLWLLKFLFYGTVRHLDLKIILFERFFQNIVTGKHTSSEHWRNVYFIQNNVKKKYYIFLDSLLPHR